MLNMNHTHNPQWQWLGFRHIKQVLVLICFFFLLGGDAKRKHEHDDEPSRSPPKRVFGYGESQGKSGSSAGDASATTSQ